MKGFCRQCWPDVFDLPFNALHTALFEAAELKPWRQRREARRVVRDAVAAPRGYAKSTISGFALLVHAMVYDLEAYIVILCAGQGLALKLSDFLRGAFQDSEGPFAQLYGPFKLTGTVSEWAVSIQGRPSIGVMAASFNTEVRGAKHPKRGMRPTRILIDDGEKKDRVRNPDQRRIWWDTLTKDVLKMGDRKGGLVVEVRGTILHTDSMLAKLMTDPGWRARRWKAMINWPERADLWERCGAIWCDLTIEGFDAAGDPLRRAAAKAFYSAHREEMDTGAEVLEGDKETLFRLYEVIWGEGLAAFLQEMQNDPVDPATQLFVPEQFARFTLETDPIKGLIAVTSTGRRVAVRDMQIKARWDPVPGTPDGDFAAIGVVGRDKFGYSYVLEVWMRKAKPSAQLAAAWTIGERWGLKTISLESNGFQALVAKPFPKQRAERKAQALAGIPTYWQLSILEEPTSENKVGRIASMEPDCTNGWLLFATSIPQEVLLQIGEFPTSSHDDGPDVIQWAWKELGGTPIMMSQQRIV